MPALATYPATLPAASAGPTRITTTLYDLVEALSTEVEPAEDYLVTAFLPSHVFVFSIFESNATTRRMGGASTSGVSYVSWHDVALRCRRAKVMLHRREVVSQPRQFVSEV